MNKKKDLRYIFKLLIFTIIIFISFKIFYKQKPEKVELEEYDESLYSSNILSDVSFSSKDVEGRSYTIEALEGEIDFNNNDIIYLKTIKATIIIDSSDIIVISADSGKYNTKSNDTIFFGNVKINYTDVKINSDYMEFSFLNNLMTISRNVSLMSLSNLLKADVIEMNISSKDTKIYMYEDFKKVKMNLKN